MNICIQSADTGTFTMNYVRFGSGKKNLVVLPGLSVQSVLLSARAVESAFKDFENDFTIYLFDRRNELPSNYSVYEMAEDTARVMETLNLEHNCIFGASQGGMMTLCIATNHPDLVDRICLGSSSSKVTSFRLFDQWISLAQNGDAKDLYLSFGKAVYPEGVFEQSRKLFEDAAKIVTKEEMDRFVILAGAIRDFDVSQKISQISCPALVIGSSDDKVLGPDASAAIADGIKEAKLIMYNGYGHAVYDTAPDFRDHMLEFFSN